MSVPTSFEPKPSDSSPSLLDAVMTALEGQDGLAAKRICQERLNTDSNDPDAHRYLGQVHSLLGENQSALLAAQRSTNLAPQDPRTWSDLGRVHVRVREWSQAIKCFAHAVDLDASHADSWHNLGTALKKIDARERAFAALKRALQIDPTRAETYLTLGNLLVEAEQLEDAIQCFQFAATHDPTLARARSRLAQELSQQGKVKQAESLFRQSLGLDSDDVASWFGLGRTMEDLGQAEAALGCYRNVLRRQPGNGMALGQYMSLVKDDEEETMWQAHAQTALESVDTPDKAKSLLGYGLAKYHSRRKEYAQSAHAGRVANAARRQKSGVLDRAALTARIDHLIETYTPDFFRQRGHFGVGTDQPVFIVGLPRSGTTLTEQILSAHPQLHGAGELPTLSRLAGWALCDEDAVPWQAAAQLEEQSSLEHAHQYLEALRVGAPPWPRRISDKQPLNFFQLAFAALLFPNARVVYCHREARDNALSIWLENFNQDQRYATDFDDLAFFTAESRRLMQHWRTALPLSVLSFKYEDTVADLEGQAKRLIAFLDVPWDDRCLDFHQVERAVQTPSRWQVRQPIYTKSVGRWKNYCEFLPELDTAFAGLCDQETVLTKLSHAEP